MYLLDNKIRRSQETQDATSTDATPHREMWLIRRIVQRVLPMVRKKRRRHGQRDVVGQNTFYVHVEWKRETPASG